jgi:hypothetical protein
MTGTEWLLTIIIAGLWVAGVIWFNRYSKRTAATLGKTDEFERNKALASVVVYPLAGSLIIMVMLFTLPEVPPGNEKLVTLGVAGGVAFILYGLYKWYRLRRR